VTAANAKAASDRSQREEIACSPPDKKTTVAHAYRKARVEAATQTGFDEQDFPEPRPYSFDDITSRAFSA
jgi:uncharacterized protein DUF29